MRRWAGKLRPRPIEAARLWRCGQAAPRPCPHLHRRSSNRKIESRGLWRPEKQPECTLANCPTFRGHLNAVLRYTELLLVEDLFRRAKARLRTRPIYHSCDAAIRGHVLLLFPRAGAAERAGRPLPIPRGQRRMGRSDPRSRPPCRRQRSRRAASASPRARRSPGRSGASSRPPALHCRQTGVNTPPDPHPPEM